MPSITLKNIPEDLLQRLRERAVRNRRSLTGEILTVLEAATIDPFDAESFVQEVREMRARYQLRAGSSDEVDRWKRSGRMGESGSSSDRGP